jgi:hypothetical protein
MADRHRATRVQPVYARIGAAVVAFGGHYEPVAGQIVDLRIPIQRAGDRGGRKAALAGQFSEVHCGRACQIQSAAGVRLLCGLNPVKACNLPA